MKKKVFLILTLVWTGFIFFNSAQTGENSASISGIFADAAMRLLKFVGLGGIDMDTLAFAVRKIAHFTEFFVQSILISCVVTQGRVQYKSVVIYVLFAGLFTACCDELLQLFIEQRGSAVADVFVDFFGNVSAVLVFVLVGILKKHFTKVQG